MNKKLLVSILVGIMALTVVNAGLLVYYGQVTAEIKVTQPITITGDLEYTIEDALAGDIVEGGTSDIRIVNSADFPINLAISNDAPEGVEVIYEYYTMYDGEWSKKPVLDGIVTVPENGDASLISNSTNWALLHISYKLDNMLETETYTVITTIDEVG